MEYQDFLNRVIDEGIEAAKADYIRDDQKDQLAGSLAGFEGCRGLSPVELADLLLMMQDAKRLSLINHKEDFWSITCQVAEIEWVCNVVSAMLHNQGLDTIVTPTARGVLKAAEIINSTGGDV